jgi:hypothetical protein
MTKRISAQELHDALGRPDRAIQMHREALEAGMSFGNYLEVLDPSEANSRLDAFGRQLREAGIVLHSDPAAGYWASEANAFFGSQEGRALYPEFYARTWREISYANTQQRAILLSSDSVIGSWDRPYTEAAGPRWNNQFQAPIPLSELVATTTPITGEDYRSMYMTYDAEAVRLFRVGESAEIPMTTLTQSSRSIRLRKYGRGIRASYEQLRRQRIDKIAWWIRWTALQSEIDKVTAALDVLVSGDGNSGTAATEINQSTIDPSATPGELSTLGWIGFRLQFAPPYTPTTVLAQVDETLQLLQLNLGTANLPLEGRNMGGIGNTLTPINSTADGVRYGWTSEAPNNKFVAFDRRFALEHVTEIGSEISETERFITNQTQVVTMTENSAFAVLDPAATKILDISE